MIFYAEHRSLISSSCSFLYTPDILLPLARLLPSAHFPRTASIDSSVQGFNYGV